MVKYPQDELVYILETAPEWPERSRAVALAKHLREEYADAVKLAHKAVGLSLQLGQQYPGGPGRQGRQ
jgi:hypothetical protein